MKQKEYNINMIVSHPDNKYSEDEISDMFIVWAESIGLICGGMVGELTKGLVNYKGQEIPLISFTELIELYKEKMNG